MNLVIDVGNTAVKMAVFQNNKILEKKSLLDRDFFETFSKTLKKFPEIKNAIISNVGAKNVERISLIKDKISLLEMDASIMVPFQNRYITPKTLGRDRMALVAGAVKNHPGENVLVIDAGTCVTYDLKTSEEVYLGGAISPGLEMRFKSLHKFTSNLPLVKPKPGPSLIGNSTENSILSGIINGLRMELKGTVESYQAKFEDLTVIFTGGDSQILSIPLKNSIFANSNFLLEGLNFILEFNKTQ